MTSWLDLAERCPIRFSQVREDPRLDLEIINALPSGASVAMIASGGDTAALLRTQARLRHLHLIDPNPAQLALTKLKLELQQSQVTPDRVLSILGHQKMDPTERSREVHRLLDPLQIDPDMLGPSHLMAEFGPDHLGRYELLFAELRRQLHQDECEPELSHWLNESLPQKADRMIRTDSKLGQAIDRAFDKVMALENLIRLFGEEATQNPRHTFAHHFVTRTRQSLQRFAPVRNPFLWQIFAGRFPGNTHYDWIDCIASPQAYAAPEMEVHTHQGMMREVAENLTPGAFDFVHLSNILDWLSPVEAALSLEAAGRILKPSGVVIIRQLNSSLKIRKLDCKLDWDTAQSASLLKRDRSFFYRSIHVGRKQKQ